MKVTNVLMVLDSSGSMGRFKKETIENFNKQMLELKELETPDSLIFVSYTRFGGTINHAFTGVPVSALVPMTEEQYKPSGNTPFYDAFGEAVTWLEHNHLEFSKEHDIANVVVVFTDGEENSSTKYSATAINALVTRLQNTKRWTFTVMGADIALDDLAKTINIPAQNTWSWTPTAAGASAGGTVLRSSVSNYMTRRNQGETAVEDFYSDSQ